MSDNDKAPAPTLLHQMGGVSGLLYAAVPSIAFVIADSMLGLTAAIGVALLVAIGIAVIRLLRRESLQPALSGALGVAVGAYLAWQTGEARDYFLLGIWASLVFAIVFAMSVLLRRPLVGVIWNALNGAGRRWRDDRSSVRGYDIATLALVLVFAARFVVQRWLYDGDHTGWLAFARIAMGYPLLACAFVVVVWAVRRSDRRLKAIVEQQELHPCQAGARN